MTRAVLDSAVLISAFLRPGGVSDAVLHQAYECAFEWFLAEEILAETRRVLLEADRIRRRYVYPDESVHRFILGLRAIAQMTGSLPSLSGIVERDPNDDMLSLRTYESITIITPEAFMSVLRNS